MASIISPSTTTTATAATMTSVVKNNNSLAEKPSQLSLFRNSNRHFARKVSCNVANNDPGNPRTSTSKVDRRNMLLGLGGLYGAASTLGGSPSSLAEPAVLDLNAPCELTKPTSDTPGGLNCCPPHIDPLSVVDFDPKNYPSPALRVRPAAHKVDAQYFAKYQEAIRRMKALPANDPRNFFQQANVHCTYCDGGFHQLNHNENLLQVHFSWLFFPFHRCYLYFFERILGKLMNDPTFAMPFWNWDHPDGMRMPTIYTDGGTRNPLFNPNRDALHQPPKLIDLAYGGGDDANLPDETQTFYNLWHMYIHVVRPRKAELFMGGKYVAGNANIASSGSLELLPHNTVHTWCGDRTKKFRVDMGTFFSAARDPIFYGHHSNIDRLWTIWKGLDGGRPQFDDSDWLNTYFVFYDENAKPVRIYVRDVLDVKKLGYTYQDIELPWLEPLKPVADRKKLVVPKTLAQTLTFPRPLGDLGFRTKVKRPKKSRSRKQKTNKEEVLEVQVELAETDEFVKFDVYLNDEHDHVSATGSTKATISYAGSFTALPHKPKANGKGHAHGKKISLKLSINEVIEDIGADNDDTVDVVLVAQSGQTAVTITDIKIKYV